jgi:hypothetical protein
MSTKTTKTAAAWIKARYHEPLLPSGFRPTIIIPDLAKLIETGAIPQDLLDVALGAVSGENNVPSIELVKTQREYTDKIVELMVIEPELTPEEIAQIPFQDKDMLVALANRQRDLDAEGEHISGLNKSEKFRKFRRLGEFDEDVAGL